MPKPLIELRRKLREVASDMLDRDGLTTGQMMLRVQEELPAYVSAANPDLAQVGLRHIISDTLHKPRAVKAAGDQEQFSFGSIVPLRTIKAPDTISVPVKSNTEADEVRWISFKNARLLDLRAHLDLLDKGIADDKAKAAIMRRIVRYFEAKLQDTPFMTVEEYVAAHATKKTKGE
jgi:hypothetical protein